MVYSLAVVRQFQRIDRRPPLPDLLWLPCRRRVRAFAKKTQGRMAETGSSDIRATIRPTRISARRKVFRSNINVPALVDMLKVRCSRRFERSATDRPPTVCSSRYPAPPHVGSLLLFHEMVSSLWGGISCDTACGIEQPVEVKPLPGHGWKRFILQSKSAPCFFR
jgi:hypothetical protein